MNPSARVAGSFNSLGEPGFAAGKSIAEEARDAEATETILLTPASEQLSFERTRTFHSHER
jgi:hypothetical protein